MAGPSRSGEDTIDRPVAVTVVASEMNVGWQNFSVKAPSKAPMSLFPVMGSSDHLVGSAVQPPVPSLFPVLQVTINRHHELD